MGKIFTVEPQQLKNTAQKINIYADTFEDIYKELLSKADTMGDAWKGTDNLKYVEKIKGLTTKLNAMAQHLRNCSKTLEQQGKNYEDRRNENIAKIGNLGE